MKICANCHLTNFASYVIMEFAARGGALRATQLYHIFLLLSIGKNAQK